MELSRDQIDQLFDFVRKKYVHWYDLQVELVDHLASRIEEEMTASPALGFDKALSKVYGGFGIFGFAHIVQRKQQELERSSRKLWWRTFRAFFGWPKILLVAASSWLLWLASKQLPPLVCFIAFLVLYIGSEVQNFSFRRRQRKMSKQLLLLELSPLRFTTGFFFFQLVVSISSTDQTALFVFGMISLLCILINLASYSAHRNVQAQAEQLYPEAFA